MSFGTEINTFHMEGAFPMDPKALQGFLSDALEETKSTPRFFSLCV
jgi:hypothetical protein